FEADVSHALTDIFDAIDRENSGVLDPPAGLGPSSDPTEFERCRIYRRAVREGQAVYQVTLCRISYGFITPMRRRDQVVSQFHVACSTIPDLWQEPPHACEFCGAELAH